MKRNFYFSIGRVKQVSDTIGRISTIEILGQVSCSSEGEKLGLGWTEPRLLSSCELYVPAVSL